MMSHTILANYLISFIYFSMMAKMVEDSWLDDLVCSVLFKPMCSLLDLGI